MLSKRLETVKLTAKFKLDGEVDENLFKGCRAIINKLGTVRINKSNV